MAMVDFRRIEQFVAIAQNGSFGRAAASLFISQPSLTRAVRSLEADLGVALFERGPRGAKLTPAGEKFLPRALGLIDEFRRARADLDPEHGPDRDRVRLGLSPNLLHALLPRLVSEMRDRSPGLDLEIYTGTAETLRMQLRAREIDTALYLTPNFPLVQRPETADLVFELMGDETIIPVARSDDPVTQAPASLETLAKRRWTIPYQLSLLYRFETAFERNRLKIPVQSVNTASLTVIRHLVIQEQLVAMMPARFIASGIDAGSISPIECGELIFKYTFALVVRRSEKSNSCLELAQKIAQIVVDM